jgi:hypothetical protein
MGIRYSDKTEFINGFSRSTKGKFVGKPIELIDWPLGRYSSFISTKEGGVLGVHATTCKASPSQR